MIICLRAAQERVACSREVGNAAAALLVSSTLTLGAASKSYGLNRRLRGGLFQNRAEELSRDTTLDVPLQSLRVDA